MIPLSTLRPFIPSLATTTSDVATRSSMGMADRVSMASTSATPSFTLTLPIEMRLFHPSDIRMAAVEQLHQRQIGWYGATITFPVEKKLLGYAVESSYPYISWCPLPMFYQILC